MHASARDGCWGVSVKRWRVKSTRLNERVQLLITTNGELQVARSDTLHLWASRQRGKGVSEVQSSIARASSPHLQILGSVTSQLQHLGSQVLCSKKQRSEEVRADREAMMQQSRDCQGCSPRMAAAYTADVAPTRPLAVTRLCKASELGIRAPSTTMASRPGSHLEQTVDTSHRELQAGLLRTRRGLTLVTLELVAHGALGTLAGETLRALARHFGLWSY